MTDSDESFDQASASEDDYKPMKPSSRSMHLRDRNKRRYTLFLSISFVFYLNCPNKFIQIIFTKLKF